MPKPAKRIVFILTTPVSFVFLRGQINYLRAHGYQVTCVSGPGKEQAMASAEGADVIAVPMKREPSPLADLVSLWRLWRVLRRTKPNVVHAGTPKAGLLGTLGATLAGVPSRIYCLMGLRFETLSGWKRWLAIWLEKIACGCANSVLCESASLRKRAIAEGLARPDKFVVAGNGSSNGVDLDHFSASALNLARAEALRNELHIAENEFVIGFVGRLVRDKGIAELLQAFETVRSNVASKLVLVGDFEDGDPIHPQLKRNLLTHDDVHIVPFVHDPAPVYRLIDVLALPTYREGFPNVVLEAQASGVPVVTTDATGAVDSVLHGKTGYVVPVGSAERLAEALIELSRSAEKRREMGDAGRARVEAEFDQKRVWEARRSFFESLLRNATRQRGPGVALKWIFDRVFAGVLLAVLSPILIIVGLFVLSTMGWPILFRQPRLGRHGKNIYIHKFRTMSQERDASGTLLPDAQRLRPIGRMLRRFSLDELPQLWDVLRGAISFVGPRPLLVRYKERYTPEQWRRHNVFQGITGWAQVNGRNALSWEDKFRLDVWYVDHWSLWLDVKILLQTVGKVLRRQGISRPGHETAPEFEGTHSTVEGNLDTAECPTYTDISR